MSNKEKYLDSAQKFLAKGQLARAVKDYQKVVELDPKDIRSRQKLGELYSRARMPSEAIEAFEGVARHYEDNGFYLKAIAVYKQMQRLDPSRPAIYQRLAELNGKQGLVGNALAEYRTLVGFYEKAGMIPEAMNILQKMKELEPENLNIRVKIIDTHLQSGSPDQARSEFGETVALLEPRRDLERLQKIYDYFIPKFPADPQMKSGLAGVLIRRGEAARGIELLKDVLLARPADENVLRLLAAGYRAGKDFSREREIWEKLLRVRPGDLVLRGEAIRARLDAGDFKTALAELETVQEMFRQGGKIALLRDYYERLHRALPEDERVLAALRSIYETTGEGGKLFDMISAAPGSPRGDDSVRVADGEELYTDSVLEDAIRDTEGIEAAALPRGGGEEAEICEHAEEIPLEFLEGIGPAFLSDVVDPPLPKEIELELELDLDFDSPSVEAEAESPSAEEGDLTFADFDDIFEVTNPPVPRGGVEEETAGAPEIPLPENSVPSKKGIKTDVEVEDPESHYNLGIAYKEMGLLDDAIREFDKALAEPSLAVACLILKGICQAENGGRDRAEETFRAALGRPALAESERMSLLYELGLLCEGDNRPKEALELYQEVAVIDLFFRNAGEKVRALRSQLGQDGSREEESGVRRKDRVSYV